MRDEDLNLYSVMIQWNDEDAEEGTYGTSVWARSPDEAEAFAREEMAAEAGLDEDEFGTAFEITEGAFWKASDLETTLRKIVELANSGDVTALEQISSIGGVTLAGLDELPVAEPVGSSPKF